MVRRRPEVLLHGAVLQILGHPRLDMPPQLAPEPATLLTLLLADEAPRGLERVWADAARVKGHLGAVNGVVDAIRPPAGET
jgi:hypothetical protein